MCLRSNTTALDKGIGLRNNRLMVQTKVVYVWKKQAAYKFDDPSGKTKSKFINSEVPSGTDDKACSMTFLPEQLKPQLK